MYEMDRRKTIYLGLDFSTQRGKAMAVDDDLNVVYDGSVSFDDDLPEFRTTGGVNYHDDMKTVTAPSAMFVESLDILLDKMASEGFDFSTVVAIGGDTQQCGSVWWKHGAREKLKNLQVGKTMYEQLKDVFSIPDPPVWQDVTSTKQCRQLEEAVGGPLNLANLVGSRGFELNTATQIMKIFQTQREDYDNTERISMLSSLYASLFIGDYASIDLGDGAIMDLVDIKTRDWSKECLKACGENLAAKLGELVPSDKIVGNISSHLVQKYKFSSDCKILAWTGDNLQSIVGLAAKREELILSMGTGDCFFMWTEHPHPNIYGHVLISAMDPYNSYLSVLVFKNGSLSRQHVMSRCAGSWEKFTEMFDSTPPGNSGNIGLFFEVAETFSEVRGIFRFNSKDEQVDYFPPEVEVRAVLESQLLARKMYALRFGYKLGPDTKILATGGASANKTILQAMADIFQSPVYVIDVQNSAALGGCYRAKLALSGMTEPSNLKGVAEPVCAAVPTPGLEKVYDELMIRYQKLEEQIATKYQKTVKEIYLLTS